MQDFRLDKNSFKGQTASAASEAAAAYYQRLDWKERLLITAYLNSEAYKFDPLDPPRMDKTVFKARSRETNG
jgi:hypothetical protein